MFTLDGFRALLDRQPFIPFRLYLGDGGSVEVRSREQVFLLRQYAIIGLLDPQATDSIADRYATVWYMHVTRAEMLSPGTPPLPLPAGPSEAPSPARIGTTFLPPLPVAGGALRRFHGRGSQAARAADSMAMAASAEP
jgi:hypothetical protein